MKNLANFLLFQAGWFVCVKTAAQGSMWTGPLVAVVIVALHLAFVARSGERVTELRYVILVGSCGLLADSLLEVLGVTRYPTSPANVWPFPVVPPWITALWVLFATLPYHSLRWLAGRPVLAAALGAIGGPLAYLAGVRLGAVEVGEAPLLTWIGLSLEYGLVTPLLLRFARSGSAAN